MRYLMTGLLAMLLLLTGCSSGNTFRVVDANTGEPIEGVKVTYERYTTLRLIPSYETMQTHHTDANGRVTVERSVDGSKDHIEFRHRGYETVRTSEASGPTVEMQPHSGTTKKEIGVMLIELLSDSIEK